jgi:hypothetical protein
VPIVLMKKSHQVPTLFPRPNMCIQLPYIRKLKNKPLVRVWVVVKVINTKKEGVTIIEIDKPIQKLLNYFKMHLSHLIVVLVFITLLSFVIHPTKIIESGWIFFVGIVNGCEPYQHICGRYIWLFGYFFWECKGLMGLSWILIGFKL